MSEDVSIETPEDWRSGMDTTAGRIWIVMPTQNDAGALDTTIQDYLNGLRPDDRVVVMANGDLELTIPVVKAAGQDDARVTVLVDRRDLGKGGALIAGLRYVARHAAPEDIVCFVDADGGVPPQELGALCSRSRPGELVIGSRWLDPTLQVDRQPPHHRAANRVYNRLIEAVVDVDLTDTQCPAKAMRVADLTKLVLRLNQSGLEFDLDLILAAQEIDLIVREVPITWSHRRGLNRHVVQEAPGAVRQLFLLRKKYGRPNAAEDRTHVIEQLSLPADDPGRVSELNRKVTVTSWGQRAVIALFVIAFAIGLVVDWQLTLIAVNAALLVLITVANIMKLMLIRRSLTRDVVIEIDPRNDEVLADADLPIYTILLPVYREAGMLRQLADGIALLDYPMDRLDVKLLLEEDDTDTLDAARAMNLPGNFDIIVVPDIGPKGKPRACNYGLARARGEYLVIYDAEDRPEPDQLRQLGGRLPECARRHRLPAGAAQLLQPERERLDQLVHRRVLLVVRLHAARARRAATCRSRSAAPPTTSAPKGCGELGGWDPFNVTEDADLGIRVYRARLHGRRGQLDHVRGGQQRVSATGSGSDPVGSRATCRPPSCTRATRGRWCGSPGSGRRSASPC